MRTANHTTSVSALLGAPVTDTNGRTVGRVRELAVAPGVDTSHVHGLFLGSGDRGKGARELVAVADVEPQASGALQLRREGTGEEVPEDADYLLMDRDVLDQQIIDVHGHKVVRVNDVELVWEYTGEDGEAHNGYGPDTQPLNLRIAEVEVGMRGAVRRLLKGLPPVTVDKIAARFRTAVIPWEFVDLIDRDPARRLRLKVEQDRLASMHPSDLADILEELAPAERQALFTSLDEGVAAEALEEVEPRLQKALTDSLDSEQIAGIVEEMDPAAAADFLAELSDERSEAILEEMDPEERQEVEELLEFPENSAAGQMTTDYVSLPVTAQYEDALHALREFEGDMEEVNQIYLVDETLQLKGIVPIVKLLLADPGTSLDTLAHRHIVSCGLDANGKKVAELFDKYNLRTLPVVDEEHKLAGVIFAEQVISQLRAKT